MNGDMCRKTSECHAHLTLKLSSQLAINHDSLAINLDQRVVKEESVVAVSSLNY